MSAENWLDVLESVEEIVGNGSKITGTLQTHTPLRKKSSKPKANIRNKTQSETGLKQHNPERRILDTKKEDSQIQKTKSISRVWMKRKQGGPIEEFVKKSAKTAR